MATKFITVSIDIMHDKNLNQSQKFILAEIEQLSQLDNGCFASNKHFSDLVGITKENVSRNIKELENMGYVKTEIKNGSRNHTRIITLIKLVRPPYQISKTPLLKQQETKENIPNNKQDNIHPLISELLNSGETVTEIGKSLLIDFIDYRKKIKKPLRTIQPLKAYLKALREIQSKGISINDAISTMKEREWQTLKPEYVLDKKKPETALNGSVSKKLENGEPDYLANTFITTKVKGY